MRRSRRHGKSLLLVFVSVVAFATATPATSGPQCFFQGLGFLPGGNSSVANGVSANGKVVVGSSNAASGRNQAFRWTAASGMVGLGFLPGAVDSIANGVSANGTVVVGSSIDATGHGPAFRWTAASGMRATVIGGAGALCACAVPVARNSAAIPARMESRTVDLVI